MRLATVRSGDSTRAARVEGDGLVLLPHRDVGSLLDIPGWPAYAEAGGQRVSLETTTLAPVIPQPRKIICVGLNFPAHQAEVGREPPKHPSLFAKFSRALIGPRDPIELPPAEVSTQADWEVELAAIIGTPVRYATPRSAAGAIAGYTVFNDISIRDWQMRTTQAMAGKTFEHTTPLGPALLTSDEVGHALDLRMECLVNGQLMQSATTADMTFPAAEVVAYVSTILTLEPGDVIALGSPPGVGAARDPQVWLSEGDVVTSRIEGIGVMTNVCTRG